MSRGLPGLSHVDHVGLTVPNFEAAVRFYCDVIGGYELYRIGPFDAAEMPRMNDGRDCKRFRHQKTENSLIKVPVKYSERTAICN